MLADPDADMVGREHADDSSADAVLTHGPRSDDAKRDDRNGDADDASTGADNAGNADNTDDNADNTDGPYQDDTPAGPTGHAAATHGSLDYRQVLLKTVLILFNSALVAVSIGLITAAANGITLTSKQIQNSSSSGSAASLATLPLGIMVLGFFLFLLAAIGIIASVKEFLSGLRLYMMLLGLLSFLLLVLGIAVYIKRDDTSSIVQVAWQNMPRTDLESLQSSFLCCGLDSPWPAALCRRQFTADNATGTCIPWCYAPASEPVPRTCLEPISSYLHDALYSSGVTVIVLAVIVVVALICLQLFIHHLANKAGYARPGDHVDEVSMTRLSNDGGRGGGGGRHLADDDDDDVAVELGDLGDLEDEVEQQQRQQHHSNDERSNATSSRKQSERGKAARRRGGTATSGPSASTRAKERSSSRAPMVIGHADIERDDEDEEVWNSADMRLELESDEDIEEEESKEESARQRTSQ